ncbi:hypothetical protein [Actinoplanes sp. OR16]|uniref:hypothetical protein n=1 Tax=Actinoplanes sp. OR16 TaxID=946334 RepID=UPI000FD9E6D9|nr:hypothetical protein [Actinoplanes sp. OR16]
MSTMVIHQPRVIWDAARAFVQAAAGPHHHEFASEVHHLLGPELYDPLMRTHDVLAGQLDRTPFDLEAGKWRVRLDEFLRAHPELTDQVRDLTARSREL